jgi:hypothetical protein
MEIDPKLLFIAHNSSSPTRMEHTAKMSFGDKKTVRGWDALPNKNLIGATE